MAGAKPLAEANRAALSSQLDAASAGLLALSTRVSTETDPAALRRDGTALVNDFRVDEVLAPKVRLSIAASYALAGSASQDGFATKLRAAIGRERAAGHDTSTAEALVADMEARSAAARGAAGPVTAMLLPLSAAGSPAGSQVLASARTALAKADAELHQAGEDAHLAVMVLRLLSVSDLKASAHRLIDERLDTLSQLATAVRASKTIDAEDRRALLTLLSGDETGLAALDRRIQADTDTGALEADVRSIYTDYRVYALVQPKVNLVLAADTLAATRLRLGSSGDRIAALIEEARSQGRDTAAAEAALSDLVAHAAAAGARLTGVSADLIGLTTAGYPSNLAELNADRRSIEDAQLELRAAGRAARLALLALR